MLSQIEGLGFGIWIVILQYCDIQTCNVLSRTSKTLNTYSIEKIDKSKVFYRCFQEYFIDETIFRDEFITGAYDCFRSQTIKLFFFCTECLCHNLQLDKKFIKELNRKRICKNLIRNDTFTMYENKRPFKTIGFIYDKMIKRQWEIEDGMVKSHAYYFDKTVYPRQSIFRSDNYQRNRCLICYKRSIFTGLCIETMLNFPDETVENVHHALPPEYVCILGNIYEMQDNGDDFTFDFDSDDSVNQ